MLKKLIARVMEERRGITSFRVTTPEGKSVLYTLDPPQNSVVSSSTPTLTLPTSASEFKPPQPKPSPIILQSNNSNIATEDENSQDYKSRHKVPMQKGFGMRDYHKIALSNKPQPFRYNIPMSEVRMHSSEEDCWTVLRGKVYDISKFVKYHPGGIPKIMLGAGKDMTALYDKYHAWVNPEPLLNNFCLGTVANESSLERMLHQQQQQRRLERLQQKEQEILQPIQANPTTE